MEEPPANVRQKVGSKGNYTSVRSKLRAAGTRVGSPTTERAISMKATYREIRYKTFIELQGAFHMDDSSVFSKRIQSKTYFLDEYIIRQEV